MFLFWALTRFGCFVSLSPFRQCLDRLVAVWTGPVAVPRGVNVRRLRRRRCYRSLRAFLRCLCRLRRLCAGRDPEFWPDGPGDAVPPSPSPLFRNLGDAGPRTRGPEDARPEARVVVAIATGVLMKLIMRVCVSECVHVSSVSRAESS